MEQVIVLNQDYQYLNRISWKRAINLVIKGKVEVLKETSRIIKNTEGTFELLVPRVIRLLKLIRAVYKSKVPFSKKNVITRDKYTCQYCGVKTDLTIDHVLPRSRGGKSSFENCVCACQKCNSFKNDRLPKEANMKLKRVPYAPTIMEFIMIQISYHGIDELLKELEIY